MKIAHGVSALVLAIFTGSAASVAFAQAEVNDPTALIISYRAKPEYRAKFRNTMATDGIAQLEKWKKDGVFASYVALFTTYAAETTPDMFLVVRFNHFTDLGRWQKIEQTDPGGLPEKAQVMAAVETSATADIVKEKTAAPTTQDSQFFILEYDVLTDMPKYVSYVEGYVAPQFDAWIKSGVLVSYSSFSNQNPAGASWSSFILLEYKNLAALASRESIKNKSRAELAVSDPVWKKWSDDKTAIRKEKAAIPALSLK
jgi:hypothetical protein